MSSNASYPIPPKGPDPSKASNEPDYERVIQEAIIHDPLIEDSDNVSVSLRQKSLGKAEIHLIGKVGSEKQKQRAQELAQTNSKDKVTVINELVVG
jgi:hypothetical protein